MPVIIECPSDCGSKYEAHVSHASQDNSFVGGVAYCPDCGERFQLPGHLIEPLIKLNN